MIEIGMYTNRMLMFCLSPSCPTFPGQIQEMPMLQFDYLFSCPLSVLGKARVPCRFLQRSCPLPLYFQSPCHMSLGQVSLLNLRNGCVALPILGVKINLTVKRSYTIESKSGTLKI